MAIDSQIKRLSITHLLIPSYPAGGHADSTVDQADRQDFMWMYRGLLAIAVARVKARFRPLGDRYIFELRGDKYVFRLRGDRYKFND